MNKRKLIVSLVGGAVTLVLIIVIAGGMKNARKEPEKKQHQKTIRKVKSELIEYTDRSSTIKATGRVLSQQSVDIIAEVQGRLLMGDIPLKEGQNFKRGDVIARIYNKDAAYTLQARKSGYLNALANILPDLKIDYNDEYVKWVQFFEQIEITQSLPELPEVDSQLKIFLASRNVLSEYYAIKSDEERLKKYTLYAPYNGAIHNVLLQMGSVANPGSRIAQILKTSKLEIEVPIEANSAAWVKMGNIANVYNETGTYLGKAKVARIASYINAQTQSINIYLSVLGQNNQVLSGGYVKVEFTDIHIAHAMEVPRNAVFNHNMIFTIDSGGLIKQEINLLKIGENTILFNGLEEGAEVVTEPLANAHEKMSVQSEYTKAPEPDTLMGKPEPQGKKEELKPEE